jgi:hypothetical protein
MPAGVMAKAADSISLPGSQLTTAIRTTPSWTRRNAGHFTPRPLKVINE